jgi:hypothetical protein
VLIPRFIGNLSISPEARMTLPQRFVISHPDEAAFKTGGLRDYSAYRDLGVAEATRGLAH